MFPSKVFKASDDSHYQSISKDVHDHLVKDNITVGFTWLLCPEPEVEQVLVPSMEDILFSNEFFMCSDRSLFLRDHCSVTDDQIKYVAKLTTGQTNNWHWGKFRQYRLTSSNFGRILGSCRRNKFPRLYLRR